MSGLGSMHDFTADVGLIVDTNAVRDVDAWGVVSCSKHALCCEVLHPANHILLYNSAVPPPGLLGWLSASRSQAAPYNPKSALQTLIWWSSHAAECSVW
jgi:hypothetical protein